MKYPVSGTRPLTTTSEIHLRTAASRSGALSALALARRALLAADFARCSTLLDAVGEARAQTDETTLLRARVHLHQNSHDEAIALLEQRGGVWKSDRARVEAAVIIAIARVREARSDADFTSAWALLDDVRGRVSRLGDPELLAELAYARALWFWIRCDCVHAEQELLATPDQCSARARCRAFMMQSFIEARRERYHRQAFFLRKALRVLECAGPDQQDIWLRANVVCLLAMLARDLPLPDVAEVVGSELRTLPWTEDLRSLRFQTVRALAWWALLQGRNDEAFGLLAEAEELAPSQAWRVMAVLQRAHLSRTMGERYWWKVDLTIAQRLAETVDWAVGGGEEKAALLLLAELCADHDPGRANEYAEAFAGARHSTTPTQLAHADRRARAFECYAAGLAQRALRDWVGAEKLLHEAFTIFRAVGCDWRAALAATALGELTHDGSWLGLARELIREYPQSWIAARLGPDHERADSELRRLKPAQQRVLFAVCEGLSSREIGRRFKRSHHTINTHLRAIYRVFQVHSRSELQAEARRRGIVRTSKLQHAS